jgi:hypothetical protein
MFLYEVLILIIYKFNMKFEKKQVIIEYVKISLTINIIILLFALILYYCNKIHKIMQYIYFLLLLKNCMIVYLYRCINNDL